MHLETTKIVNAANASSADCYTRLRDNETKVTEACGILVFSIVLHIVPVYGATPSTADDSTSGDAKGVQVDGEDAWLQVFETVSAPLLKDTNAVGENATKCLCSVLRPTEFDGHTLPSDEILLAHATRVHSFFRSILSASVAKMNGSTMYASFSPIFLLLQSACQLAHESERNGVISRASRNALCAAFIELLEDGDHDDTTNDPFGTHDAWLVFTWLRDLSKRNTNVKQIDPRALRALEQRLVQWSMTPSAAGLEAAHVLSQLGF
ncbi:hypothetical protein FI667_g6470, partial [Globisporangium splendens]